MSIEDGYFLAGELASVNVGDDQAVRDALQAYEERRKPDTRQVVQAAYRLERMFHHLPRVLRPVRDLVFDRTPFLQNVNGDATPRASSVSSTRSTPSTAALASRRWPSSSSALNT